MASSRHFFKQPVEQTRAEIKADIKNSRKAQRDAAANGQHRAAEMMRQGTDEALDELNRLNNGTWKPNHA
ncbi:hypothetical protein [Streptomyces sp. B27]|uniref:hypothetical protein n=1 Tax=Streptomyces sp. B27 TaxID=2485015 RepID=UPI000FD7A629|nr:hypothetical protein [Streptomyces sp. B27]